MVRKMIRKILKWLAVIFVILCCAMYLLLYDGMDEMDWCEANHPEMSLEECAAEF